MLTEGLPDSMTRQDNKQMGRDSWDIKIDDTAVTVRGTCLRGDLRSECARTRTDRGDIVQSGRAEEAEKQVRRAHCTRLMSTESARACRKELGRAAISMWRRPTLVSTLNVNTGSGRKLWSAEPNSLNLMTEALSTAVPHSHDINCHSDVVRTGALRALISNFI